MGRTIRFNQANQRETQQTPTEIIALAQATGLAPGKPLSKGRVPITCPECGKAPTRNRLDRTVLFLDHGGFKCLSCGASGSIFKVARQRVVGDRNFTNHTPSRPQSSLLPISRVIDLEATYLALTGLKTTHKRAIIRWVRQRGFSIEVAHAIAELPDITPLPNSTPGSSAGARGARVLRRLSSKNSLFFWMRGLLGRLASAKQRGQGQSIKSKELPNSLTGKRGFRAFGFEPDAIKEALEQGKPVILVEGEVDWAVTQAALNLTHGGVALGAWNNRDMATLAGHVAELIPNGTTPHIHVFPDEDGKTNSATKDAADEAVSKLRRAGARVHLVTIPDQLRDDESKADASDVLLRLRSVHDFIAFILEAPLVPSRARNLDEQRRRMGDEMAPQFLTRPGQYVLNSDMGAGKTFIIAIKGVLKVLQEDPSRRVVIGFNTRALAQEKYEEALAMAPEGVNVSMLLGRHEDNCEMIRSQGQEVVQAAASLKPKGASHLCHHCPFRKSCRMGGYLKQQQRLKHSAMTGLIIVTTNTLNMYPELRDKEIVWTPSKGLVAGADTLIYDEFPETIKAEITLDVAQVETLLEQGGLVATEANALALLGLLAKSKAKADDRDLARILPPESLSFDASRLDLKARKALVEDLLKAPERAQDLLNQHVPWHAADLLSRACRQRWQGCYVEAGKLIIPARPCKVPLAQGQQQTLILDATMTHKAASTLLSECVYHDIGGLAPETCHITYTDFEINSSNLKRPEVQALDLAVRRLYGNDTTLHGTHKAHINTLQQALETGDLRGKALHHGGTLARGSNAYQHFDTVILNAYHVPKAAKRALAQRLALRAGHDDAEEFMGLATYLLEEAPMIQLAGRVRYNDGSPARIIILSQRRLPGLPCDDVLRKADLMIEAGLVPKGREAMVPLLRELVKDAGGILAPGFWPTEPVSDGDGTALVPFGKEYVSAKGDMCGAMPVTDGLREAKIRSVTRSAKKHYGRNWDRVARAADLLCTYVQTSRRGGPVAVLHRYTLTHEDLRRALTGHVDWFEAAGGRIHLQSSPLERAARSLINAGKAVSVEALATHEGISERAVRKRIKVDGWSSPSAFLEHYGAHQLQAVSPPPTVEEPVSAEMETASTSLEDDFTKLALWQHRKRQKGQGRKPSGMELARVGLRLELCGSLWSLTRRRAEAWSWSELAEHLQHSEQHVRSMAQRRVSQVTNRLNIRVQQRWREAPPMEPEDMGQWSAVCRAVAGERKSLRHVLGVYLPGVGGEDAAELMARLEEQSEEDRALCMESLWVVGGVGGEGWRRVLSAWLGWGQEPDATPIRSGMGLD